MHRLSVFGEGEWRAHQHQSVYGAVEGEGVAAAPTEQPIALLSSLLDGMQPPVTLKLEVLEPMGLDNAQPVSWTAPASSIREWLMANATWLEGDARLAVEISDAEGNSARFDEHDLIWLRGDVGVFEPFLLAAGLIPGEIELPFPHAHQYRQEWTPAFESMLARLR
jgi:hypothetical protein